VVIVKWQKIYLRRKGLIIENMNWDTCNAKILRHIRWDEMLWYSIFLFWERDGREDW